MMSSLLTQNKVISLGEADPVLLTPMPDLFCHCWPLITASQHQPLHALNHRTTAADGGAEVWGYSAAAAA